MRVLHICSYYYPHIGGIEQVARDCVRSLKGLHEQRVLCFDHEKGTSYDTVDGIQIVRAGCFAKISSQSLSLSYGRLLKRTFREFAPELVIFHYPNPFLAHSLLKRLRKSSCKLIVWWHLDITKQKILGKFFKGQTRRLLARAKKVVATSPNYIEGSEFLPSVREKCIVIPNCADSERISWGEREEELASGIRDAAKGKTILLAVGRHVPYKGMEYLIRASALLDDSFAIFIGGHGPLTKQLKELARVDGKITFLDTVSIEQLKGYFLACDIFCFPSVTKNEAFGIALAEAMAFGKPSVTFTIDGSGVNYVSLNGETGIEVENGNVEKFADAIKKLSADEQLRKQYGEAARLRVSQLFSEKSFAERARSMVEGCEQSDDCE